MLDLSLLPNADSYYHSVFALKGRKRKNLVPCCFHHDKSPSLSLDLNTGRFNCFGCGVRGGDILDFHKLKHGLSTTEAAKDLGAWASTQSERPERPAKDHPEKHSHYMAATTLRAGPLPRQADQATPRTGSWPWH